jgi:hypothetical protein
MPLLFGLISVISRPNFTLSNSSYKQMKRTELDTLLAQLATLHPAHQETLLEEMKSMRYRLAMKEIKAALRRPMFC